MHDALIIVYLQAENWTVPALAWQLFESVFIPLREGLLSARHPPPPTEETGGAARPGMSPVGRVPTSSSRGPAGAAPAPALNHDGAIQCCFCLSVETLVVQILLPESAFFPLGSITAAS